MQLTKIAIHRPVTTTMFALALVFLGAVSYRELPVQRFPDITLPSLYYMAQFPDKDLSPEKTNDDITRPFEKMVASLPGVREMRSTTYSSYFWGYTSFERGTDMRFRVIELQGKVNKWVAGQTDEIVTRVIPASTEEMSGGLMRAILSIPVGREFQTAEVTDMIRRKLRSIDGVSKVDIAGEMLPNIMLEAQRDELLAVDMDVQDLVQAVNRAARDKAWLGTLKEGNKDHEVHLKSKIETVDELLKIRLDDRGILSLGSLAQPQNKIEEQENVFRFNGKKAVRVTIGKEKDRNTIRMARKVRAEIASIKKELPEGFDLSVKRDEAESLEKLIAIIAKLGLLGSFLAMAVILLFVRNWRIALVVAVCIPTSVVITFNAMYAADLTINMLSLLGLAVAVGMLVDNAIVVVENVFRHSQRCPDAREAAYRGSSEVGRAILISTCTNLTVFLPLLYADEMMVLIMKDIALSFVFPMVVSLLIAVTLIPMLTAKVIEATGRPRFVKDRSGKQSAPRRDKPLRAKRVLPEGALRVRLNPWQKPNRMSRNYLREFVFYCSKGSIRHPVRLLFTIVCLLFATLFASSIKLAVQGFEESQQTETESVTIYGKPPLGSKIKDADRFFQRKEGQVSAEVDAQDFFESFSSRFSKTGGEITLNIPEEYQKYELDDFQEVLRRLIPSHEKDQFAFNPFPEASVDVQMAQSMRSGYRMREAVVIRSENMEAMLRAAEKIKKFLEDEPNVSRTRVETPPGQPEVHFSPDLELFQVMKADPDGLRIFFESRSETGFPTQLDLEEKGIERKVTVKVVSEEEKRREGVKQTLSELKRANIPLLGGGMIPIDRLGTFKVTQGVPNITKKDRQRELRVGYDFNWQFRRASTPKQIHNHLLDIQKRLNNLYLPMGVTATLEGSLKEADKSWVLWKKMISLAVLCLYVVMAFFFESLVAPLVILATLPLACIGGIWGLIVFNASFGPIAILGSLLLSGLVVNNGILLIEYTRQMQRRGMRRQRALMAAVSYRLRPILMTSLTTLLGLLPILMSERAKEIHPLISVLIGGIVTSGLLSLVVVPSLYNTLSLGLDNLRAWEYKMRSQRRGIFRIAKWFAPSPDSEPSIPHSALRIPHSPDSSILLEPSGFPIADVPPFEPPASERALRISVENVSKIYPAFRPRKLLHFIPAQKYPFGHRPLSGTVALKRVSLEIESGMFGLLGPNGAGKTTLMKILTGIVEPTYGGARVAGNDLRYHYGEIRRYISYLPQNFGVYESLTLNQYLNFFAPYYGLNDGPERRRKIEEVAGLVGLGDVRDKPMKRFSGGMRQRAGIAQMFLNPQPIIIVDEPTAGLDPVERVRFRLLLSELARTRIVILSTHIVDDITSSCRRVAVLNRGEIIYQGGLEGIRACAENRIWDVTLPAGDTAAIPRKQVLYRKHVGDRILYHYVSSDPLPGSERVDPSFEDAYVALLLKHDTEESLIHGSGGNESGKTAGRRGLTPTRASI